jgi:deazaflavin-dependent oxidoreductase (nitroreductase family)
MIEHSFVEGKIYVVPGWGQRTQWYRNIQADPHVTVQRRGQTFSAIACRVAGQSELSTVFHHVRGTSPMWKPFLSSWGIEDNLEDFLSKRDRIIALRLDRTEDHPTLPPLRVDLWWVWLLLAVLSLLNWHWQA